VHEGWERPDVSRSVGGSGAVVDFACEHPDHYLARYKAGNGVDRLVEFCPDCQRIVSALFGGAGAWLPLSRLPAGLNLDALPLVASVATWRTCEACQRPSYCERHHYSPVALFGLEEAERHPVRWLCRPCHERWHLLMGMPIGRTDARRQSA